MRRCVIRAAFGAQSPVWPPGRSLREHFVEAAEIIGYVTRQPSRNLCADMRSCRPPSLGQGRIDDDVIGAGRGHAMGQPRTGELGVDQGSGDPDLGQAEPDRQIVWTIFHEQGDRRSGVDPQVIGPGCIAVGSPLQVRIGPAFVLEQDRDARGMAVDGAFKIVRDVDPGSRLQTPDAGKRPQASAEEPYLATEPGEQSGHASGLPMLTNVRPPVANVSDPVFMAAMAASRSNGTLIPAWAAGRAAIAPIQR